VVMRCRQLFGKVIVEGRKSIVTIDSAGALIAIKCPESDQLDFEVGRAHHVLEAGVCLGRIEDVVE
jgi:hypothetical protein